MVFELVPAPRSITSTSVFGRCSKLLIKLRFCWAFKLAIPGISESPGMNLKLSMSVSRDNVVEVQLGTVEISPYSKRNSPQSKNQMKVRASQIEVARDDAPTCLGQGDGEVGGHQRLATPPFPLAMGIICTPGLQSHSSSAPMHGQGRCIYWLHGIWRPARSF